MPASRRRCADGATPVLVMSVGVADDRVQNQVLRDGGFRPACSTRMDERVVHRRPDVAKSMARLAEPLLRVVAVDRAFQQVVAVMQLASAAREGLGRGATVAVELG